jgi:3-hydroxyisobutyryl-CoA hydrolase
VHVAGIATHFIPSENIEQAEGVLLELASQSAQKMQPIDVEKMNNILTTIGSFGAKNDGKKSFLTVHADEIDSCFGHGSVPEIIDSVEQLALQHTQGKGNQDHWSIRALQQLKNASPTSMAITLEALKRGKNESLAECLEREFAISMRLITEPDFVAGVNAVLSKQRVPAWQPMLGQVDEEAFFHECAHGKLGL